LTIAQYPKWPKSVRFTLTQRIENLALDVVEDLVVARYRREGRGARLAAVNLRLERMRHLLRLAKGAGRPPSRFSKPPCGPSTKRAG
jgi:hypothetical protein